MKYRTAELEGALLDAAVALAEGVTLVDRPHMPDGIRSVYTSCWQYRDSYDPSCSWALAGPIIERERIELMPQMGHLNQWHAKCVSFVDGYDEAIWFGIGATPLMAAMRAYVASKLGDEVDLS